MGEKSITIKKSLKMKFHSNNTILSTIKMTIRVLISQETNYNKKDKDRKEISCLKDIK